MQWSNFNYGWESMKRNLNTQEFGAYPHGWRDPGKSSSNKHSLACHQIGGSGSSGSKMQIQMDMPYKEPARESPLNHQQGLTTTLLDRLWGSMSTASTFVCSQAWTWSLPVASLHVWCPVIRTLHKHYTRITTNVVPVAHWAYVMRKYTVWSIRNTTCILINV